MARKRHPGKEIEMALRYAESHGWLVITGGHHAWGKMYCPKKSVDVPMRGVLSDLYLEHIEKRSSTCPCAAARGR